MATYSVTLTPSRASAYAHRRNTTRLKVVASGGVNVPNEIFVHKQWLIDPYNNTTDEEFVHIAKVEDLSLYPKNEPDPDPDSPPFYRKDTIDIQLPGNVDAEEVLAEIYRQIGDLLKELAAVEELEEEEPVTLSETAED